MKETASTFYQAAHQIRLVADALAQCADDLQSDLDPVELERVLFVVESSGERLQRQSLEVARATSRMQGRAEAQLEYEARA